MASALPPTQAPAKDEYAGDEINALVLDPGSHTTRAGFAGEDTPKSVCPTHYGRLASGDRVFGENGIHVPRGDMDIHNPFNTDGLVEDWDTAADLWEYAITSRLTGPRPTPSASNGLNDGAAAGVDVEMGGVESVAEQERPLAEYPLLMSEPAWNPAKSREKTMQIAMEKWGVPAFFLAKTGQLAAFAAGKASALVVDVGHHQTSVVALWEGMVLRRSSFHSSLAGAFLSNQIRLMFEQHEPPVPLLPHYLVKSKLPVDANTPSNATFMSFAKPPSNSFRAFEEERVLTSFKESVAQVWPGPGRLEGQGRAGESGAGLALNWEYVKSQPSKPFELPDGWNTVFGPERLKVTEGLFDPRAAYTSPEHPAPSGEQTITSLANKAINACDIDTRAMLLNNVVLTGAGSLVDKLPERLHSDLQTMYPNPRVRIIANSSAVERKYGAWIGGSVLASLGTFHQMWVSREEYAEYGSGIVEKRCK